jgi:hypothetical protein
VGHKRYGYLPKSKIWREIVDSLGDYSLGRAEISEIAKSTLRQIQTQYNNLKNDPSINAAYEYLIQVSLAFKKDNPLKYLTENKIIDREELSLLRLAKGAIKYKSEEVTSHEYQTFARQAAIDAINNWYKDNIERGRSLFSEEIDSNAIFRKTARADGFCELSRLYFSKLTERYLKYFLEREASSRISNVNERERFSNAIKKQVDDISKHAFETAKITESFSAGWFNNHVKDNVPKDYEIKNFLSTSFGKMKSELLREEGK